MTALSLSHSVLSADLFGATDAFTEADGGAMASERAAFDAALARVADTAEAPPAPTRARTVLTPETVAPEPSGPAEEIMAAASSITPPAFVTPRLVLVPSMSDAAPVPEAAPKAEGASPPPAPRSSQAADMDVNAPEAASPDAFAPSVAARPATESAGAAVPADAPSPRTEQPFTPKVRTEVQPADGRVESAGPAPRAEPSEAPETPETPTRIMLPATAPDDVARTETPQPKGDRVAAPDLRPARETWTVAAAPTASPAPEAVEAAPPQAMPVAAAPVAATSVTAASIATGPIGAAPIAAVSIDADSAPPSNRNEPTVGRDVVAAPAPEQDDGGANPESNRDRRDRAPAEARAALPEAARPTEGARPVAAATPSSAPTVAAPATPAPAVAPPAVVPPAAESATPSLPLGATGAPADAISSTPVLVAQNGGQSALSRGAVETTARIAAQIIRTLEGQASRFEMVLTPESLGRVDVSLDIGADGRLHARLAFDSPAAAVDVRGRVDELRRQLEEAGFTLGDDALEFAERDPGASRDDFDRGHGRAFAQAGRVLARADAEAPAPVASVWTSLSLTPRGVDLKV